MRFKRSMLTLAAAALTACSGGADQSADSAPHQAIVLGFSQIGSKSAWRTANTISIQSAARAAAINLEFSTAQLEREQESQIEALRGFIAQRVDVIAFSPVVESGWETVLREARRAGIPVILADRAAEVADHSLYLSRIGSDFVEEGRKAGRWLLEYYANGAGKGVKGDVNIAELQGTMGSAPANDRKKGFAEVISADPRFKIIRSQTADFEQSKGKEVMEGFIKAEGKRINVLFAHNDDMALGAIEAIESAGFKPGADIIIISIDAAKAAFEAMLAGKLNVAVECDPLLGPQLMSLVKDVAAGRPIPRRIITAESVFPMETAAQEFPKRKY